MKFSLVTSTQPLLDFTTQYEMYVLTLRLLDYLSLMSPAVSEAEGVTRKELVALNLASYIEKIYSSKFYKEGVNRVELIQKVMAKLSKLERLLPNIISVSTIFEELMLVGLQHLEKDLKGVSLLMSDVLLFWPIDYVLPLADAQPTAKDLS